GRPVQAPQEFGDVVFVVEDAELLLDHTGDSGAGPDLAWEAVSLRAVPEELGDEPLLLWREVGRATGARSGAEGLHVALAGAGGPVADGDLGDAQSPRDSALGPAVLLQLPRPKPPPLAPVPRLDFRGPHTSFYRPRSLNPFMRRSVTFLECGDASPL